MKKVLVLIALLCVACLAQAEEPAAVSADLGLAFQQVGDLLKTNLDANAVLGTPVTAGDVTIIPIVVRGFGFGMGEKVRSETEVKSHDKASKEGEKGNKGIGCGAGVPECHQQAFRNAQDADGREKGSSRKRAQTLSDKTPPTRNVRVGGE